MPRLDGVRVLVVEDNADSRDLFTVMLEGWGAAVIATGSGAEAIEWLHRERFDVLVSDINLPEEDGFTLLRKVRALPPERGGRMAACPDRVCRHRRAIEILAAGFRRTYRNRSSRQRCWMLLQTGRSGGRASSG
jgi:CheY-like chemotaxis protein